MGQLVPPPMDHPDFERIMRGRLRFLSVMRWVLIVGQLLCLIGLLTACLS